MPAILPALLGAARHLVLALAGLGLVATSMSALPAGAATGDRSTDELTTSSRPAPAARVNTRVLSAKDTAMRQRGDAYAYGATGPGAFDCSGLIYFAYRQAGFPVPRTSGAQAGFTRRIAKSNMSAGDLMFFYGSGGVYHAAIFIGWSRGHATMVHSPGSGQRVRVAVPWTSRWFGGTLRR